MKIIEINYDNLQDKSKLSQALKVVSLNYNYVIFNIKSTKDKLTEFDGYKQIKVNYTNLESSVGLIDGENNKNKYNAYLIRSSKQKTLLLNLSFNEFVKLKQFSEIDFVSTFEIKTDIQNYKGLISFEDLFNTDYKIILIDNINLEGFIKGTKLISSYFLIQQKQKDNKKGFFSRLNETFFKNYQSSTPSYANLYDDIFLPFCFNIEENFISLYIKNKANINNYINCINILVSLLNNTFKLD